MPDLNDLSWSGFAEFARQWILLNRKKLYESGSGEHYLNMVIGGSVGFGGMYSLEIKEGQLPDRYWQPTVEKGGGLDRPKPDTSGILEQAEAAHVIGEKEQIVLKFLKENSNGVTKTEIKELPGIGKRNIDSVLDTLQSDGRVRKAKEKRKGVKPTDYYYLTAQEEEQ